MKSANSVKEVFEAINGTLGKITGKSEKQIAFAEKIRTNVIWSMAHNQFDAQSGDEIRVENAEWTMKSMKFDYDFAVSETDAGKLLDRFANTGWRNGVI